MLLAIGREIVSGMALLQGLSCGGALPPVMFQGEDWFTDGWVGGPRKGVFDGSAAVSNRSLQSYAFRDSSGVRL
jgi:hypothetical protein